MKKMIMVLFSAATLAVLNCFAGDTYWATGELNVSKTRGETIILQFDIPKSYTHIKTATLTINAWDVDTQDGKERDEVYLNGKHLGKLYGGTDCWDLNQFSVPVSAINSGINQLHIVADADNNGWWTKIEYAKLVVDGSVYPAPTNVQATTDDPDGVIVTWDAIQDVHYFNVYFKDALNHDPILIDWGTDERFYHFPAARQKMISGYYAVCVSDRDGNNLSPMSDFTMGKWVAKEAKSTKPIVLGVSKVTSTPYIKGDGHDNRCRVIFNDFSTDRYKIETVIIRPICSKGYGAGICQSASESPIVPLAFWKHGAYTFDVYAEYKDLRKGETRYTDHLMIGAAVYFDRYGVDYEFVPWVKAKNGNVRNVPNWFKYWHKNGDGALSQLDENVFYDFSLKRDNVNGEYTHGGSISLGDGAARTKNSIQINIDGKLFILHSNCYGLNACAETLAHENNHKYAYQKNGFFSLDSDGDGLSNSFEKEFNQQHGANCFDIHNPDTQRIADYFGANSNYKYYGDDEFYARYMATGKQGDSSKDWSYYSDYTPHLTSTMSLRNSPNILSSSDTRYLVISSDSGRISEDDTELFTIPEGVELKNFVCIKEVSDFRPISDGLNTGYSSLEATLHVICTNKSEVTIFAYLDDLNGQHVAWSSVAMLCDLGEYDIPLRFDGETIYKAGGKGYSISYIKVAPYGIDFALPFSINTNSYESTQAYDNSDFARSKYTFSDIGFSETETGELSLNANIICQTNGAHKLIASIVGVTTSNVISRVVNDNLLLSKGTNAVEITFDKKELYASAEEHAIVLSSLLLIENDQVVESYNGESIQTSFNFKDFRSMEDVLDFVDWGVLLPYETNLGIEGLSAQFRINNSSNATISCNVQAVLYGTNNMTAAECNYYVDIVPGTNAINVAFSGSSIRSSQIDGPYFIKTIMIRPVDISLTPLTMTELSETTNFSYMVFSVPSKPLLGDIKRLPNQNNAIRVLIPVTTVSSTNEIVIKAILSDSTGNMVSSSSTTSMPETNGRANSILEFYFPERSSSDIKFPLSLSWIGITAEGLHDEEVYNNINFTIDSLNIKYYVSTSGHDSNDGYSWESAKRTIDAAVNDAYINDEIIIGDGTYASINTEDKGVVIKSQNGPIYTIIDGGGETRCANLGSNTSQTNTVLVGFTLRNGLSSTGGGAYGGTLKNCIIENNKATNGGGGVCYSVLEDCQLKNNSARYGGGAYMSVLHRCLVIGNKATGLSGGGLDESTAYDCVIQGNSAVAVGGGAYDSSLYNCTVIGNSAVQYGGGVSKGVVVNSIIWENTAATSNNHYRAQGTYNCTTPLLQGDGNIESDPLLRGAEFGGFMLSAGSPCIDAGLDDEYTTADYVRAGLVGHWDGIDNAGTGTHDPTTRVWTDLTGQTGDGDLASSVVWCDGECWSNNVYGKPIVLRGTAFADTVSANIFTIEFIVRPSRSDVRQSYIGSWETGKFGIEQNSGRYTDGSTRLYFNDNPDIKADNAKIAAGELAMISVVATASACYVYKNGILVNTYNDARAAPTAGVIFVIGGENARDAMAFCGKYYAMRLYNRALSTSEVAANYAIDKKRYRDSVAGIATASQKDFMGNARIQGSHVDMGAVEGVTNACFVMTRTVGGGSADVSFELVEPHSSLAITADESIRPIDHFKTNDGRVITGSQVQLDDITSDTFLTAYFKYYDFYADAQNGDDANDGLSWSSAKRTLQAAIDCAVDGEKIRVAKGVYEPIVTNDKAVEIEAVEGALVTSIDGGGTNRCATLATSGSMASKTNSVLVGFTLTNGRATQGAGAYGGTLKNCIIKSNTADGSTYCYGGGTYYGVQYDCRYEGNSASATMYGYGGAAYNGTSSNCVYLGNSVYGPTNAYGGAIYSGTHYDCAITNNTSSTYGGGVSGGTYYRTSVVRNEAKWGGGCYNATFYDGEVLRNTATSQGGGTDYGNIYRSVISNNRSNGDGGGAYKSYLTDCAVAYNQSGGSGGGALLTDYSATRTVFKKNIARGSGGGVYGGTCTDCGITNNTATSNGGGAYNITATRTSFVGNSAANGGGIYSGTYNSCTIEGNTSTGEGGGAYGGTFYDSLISGNEASGVGGGLRSSTFHRSRIVGNRSNGDGGGVYNGTGYNSLIVKNKGLGNGGGTYSGYNYNCTITENWCGGKGGGTNSGYQYNTIIVDNSDPDGEYNQYNCSAFYNSIASNSDDPMFVNSVEGDYRLRVGSYCINAGNNSYANGSTDIALATRIQGGMVDMGCYEGGVDGFVVSVNSVGVGDLEYDPSVVTNGGSFTISASSTGRAFLCFKTNDVVATAAPTLTLDGITGDVKVTAEFVHEMFVDGTNGADDNNGLSWATAKKSIQAAIDASADGDTIWIADGVYEPIATNDRRIDIVSVNGAAKTIIDGEYLACCARLGTDSRFSDRSRLSGFTLRNGYDSYGGGVRFGCVDNCIIENCQAKNNGGGVDYSNISNCIVRNNSAQKSGGGFTGGAWRRAVNCKFIGNTAREHGGGVTGGAQFRNCEFLNNIADGNGGGVNGGTVYDSIFAGNRAVTGGATYNGTFYRCTLSGNTSTGEGGGGYSGTFYDSVISNNTASGVGGGLRDSTFHRSHVVCNKASGDGGGVYNGTGYNSIIAKNKANGNGGGTYSGYNYNCTITENYCADQGGGTQNGYQYNSIVWNNGKGSNRVQGGANNCNGGSVYNCQTENPRFVNAAEGDYRLRVGSPCLNVGNASYVNGSLDVASRARVQDGTVDIGAHEGAVDGFVVDVTLHGGATISHSSAVVGSNGTFTVYDVSSVRPFAGIFTNGVFASSTTPFTLSGITSDVELTVDCAHDLYVDSDNGDDGNNGFSRDDAKQSIQAAVNISLSGDVIHVADGYYEPFSSGNRDIHIISDNGPDNCIVDGEYSTRCATLGSSPSEVQTTIEGLTLCNGYSSAGGGCYYGMAINCIVADCYSTGDGGGSYGTLLRGCTFIGNVAGSNGGASCGNYVRAGNCTFVDNMCYGNGGGVYGGSSYDSVFDGNWASSNGGAAYGCWMQRCIMRNNQASTGGGTYNGTMYSCLYYDNYASSLVGGAYYGTMYNCTLTRNRAAGTTGGMYYSTAYNTICRYNQLNSGVEDNSYGSSYYNCCLTSSQGTNTLRADPLFFDAANDDFRLSMNSPCLNRGDNSRVSETTDLRGLARIQDGTVDIGCYEGPVNVWQITIAACGHGVVLDNGTSTLDGGDLSFTAVEDGTPFLGFYTNGVFATTEKEFTWRGISGHSTLEAWFKQDIYVDASMVDDSGDGLTWKTARKDLAAVVAETSNGANIWVKGGAYTPIISQNKKLVITAVDGNENTIISGGGMEQCANLIGGNGSVSTQTNTVLIGFTLRDGLAANGGGAVGGTLHDCTIVSNLATNYGGGTYYGVQHGCVYRGNIVSNNAASACGGAAFYGTSYKCTYMENQAAGATNTCGGAIYGGVHYDCIVSGNKSSRYGGGIYVGTYHRSTITGNFAYIGGGCGNATIYDSLICRNSARTGGGGYIGKFYGCTIVDNVATNYGGAYSGAATNSIVYGNSVMGGTYTNWYSVAMQYSCSEPLANGAGNICADPLFVDLANGNYRLTEGSPCLNAGYNIYVHSMQRDIDSHNRILDGVVDMGCYEGVFSIVAETQDTPAPVPHVWLDAYPDVLTGFGGDYEAMASAPSPGASGGGKTWPNGSPCYVWQDFVAGTSPTNDTVFTATIRMEGNTPVITWEPDTPELRATRVYRTLGKKTLLDANWTDITDKDQSAYRFFKVTVDLP